MLPNHRLLARAFHRVPVTISKTTSNASTVRRLSNSSINQKWEGSKGEDHIVRETDSHNVQQDAARSGKAERALGEASSGTSEKAGMKREENLNEKAKRDHKEAPKPVIGMNDERGSK